MKIHEYQAKAVLARYGVPVPRGEVASSAGEALRFSFCCTGNPMSDLLLACANAIYRLLEIIAEEDLPLEPTGQIVSELSTTTGLSRKQAGQVLEELAGR